METSVALSLLALFAAVFVSLSARLAHAQHQQQSRIAALHLLESHFHQVREMRSEDWTGYSESWEKEENQVDYNISIRLVESESDLPEGFAVFQGTVSWRSSTGPQHVSREVWIHERLN